MIELRAGDLAVDLVPANRISSAPPSEVREERPRFGQGKGDDSPIARLRAAAPRGAGRRPRLASRSAGARRCRSVRGSNDAAVASGDHGQTIDPDRGATVARFARRMVGVPYVTAGATPSGVDCSGLTMLAYCKIGTKLGHSTGDQWNSGDRVKVASMSNSWFAGNFSGSVRPRR